MIHHHKRSIEQLARLLHSIDPNGSDLSSLLTMQRLLVRRIRSSERRTALLKRGRSQLKGEIRQRASKELSTKIKAELKRIDEKLEEEKYLRFVWRCFGDGIAFRYIDKHALKHLFYSTVDYSVKPEAGALTDKAGFRREWILLKSALSHGVPTVLCDLTNTLRHGDICLLGSADPLAIEVKSSKNSNARVDRQKLSLMELSTFFKNDGAENFRGLSKVVRRESPLAEVAHAKAMNRCISLSRNKGIAYCRPESGLVYVAIREGDIEATLDRLMKPGFILVNLNETKRDRSWPPFFPFTLTLRPSKNLYDFIAGKVTLIVMMDVSELRKQFASHNLLMEFLGHPNWPIRLTKIGASDEGVTAPSALIFYRVVHEFLSIRDFVNQQAHGFVDLTAITAMEAAAIEEQISAGTISIEEIERRSATDPRHAALLELQPLKNASFNP